MGFRDLHPQDVIEKLLITDLHPSENCPGQLDVSVLSNSCTDRAFDLRSWDSPALLSGPAVFDQVPADVVAILLAFLAGVAWAKRFTVATEQLAGER